MPGSKAIGVSQSVSTHADVSYTAHSSGSTPVTSNAATDLDTTAAGLAALVVSYNSLLAKLRSAGIVDS